MKCKRIDCEKNAVSGQVYCSKEHAPYGQIGNPAPIPYQKTGASSFKARTEVSQESSDVSMPTQKELEARMKWRKDEKQTNSVMRPTPSNIANASANGGPPAPKMNEKKITFENEKLEVKTVNTTTPVREISTSEIAKSSFGKSLPEESKTTPRMDSRLSSKSFETGILISTNLIDDSINDLRNLMGSIAANAQKDVVARNVQAVNAACNCAKNIAQLMRLKLDVVKESRK